MRVSEVQVAEVERGRDEIEVPAALGIGPGGDLVEVEGLAAAIVGLVIIKRDGHAFDRPALARPGRCRRSTCRAPSPAYTIGGSRSPALRGAAGRPASGPGPSPLRGDGQSLEFLFGNGMTMRPDSSVMCSRAILPLIQTFKVTPERGCLVF